MRKVALPKLLPQTYQSHSWGQKKGKKAWNQNFYKLRQEILKASKVWVSYFLYKNKKEHLGKWGYITLNTLTVFKAVNSRTTYINYFSVWTHMPLVRKSPNFYIPWDVEDCLLQYFELGNRLDIACSLDDRETAILSKYQDSPHSPIG